MSNYGIYKKYTNDSSVTVKKKDIDKGGFLDYIIKEN